MVLSVRNLTKTFSSRGKKFTAVDHIGLELKEGEILGLLGPNGAGKTTTIQMLLGITTPTSGSISYFGTDLVLHKQQCLQRINFTSAFNTLQGRTTVWENLLVFGYLYQIKDPKRKIEELLEYFHMKDMKKQRYHDLSSGQQTRVNLMKSLLNDPEIILMDEPTASLDPDISDKVLSLIEGLKKDRHISILYTSHNMHEVTRICDRVIFMDHGKIVAHDTPLGLTKRIERAMLQLTFDQGKDKVEEYMKEHTQEYEFANENVVIVKTHEKLIPKLIFGLSKQGVWITDIEVQKPTLDDVFLQIARGKSYVFQQD